MIISRMTDAWSYGQMSFLRIGDEGGRRWSDWSPRFSSNLLVFESNLLASEWQGDVALSSNHPRSIESSSCIQMWELPCGNLQIRKWVEQDRWSASRSGRGAVQCSSTSLGQEIRVFPDCFYSPQKRYHHLCFGILSWGHQRLLGTCSLASLSKRKLILSLTLIFWFAETKIQLDQT